MVPTPVAGLRLGGCAPPPQDGLVCAEGDRAPQEGRVLQVVGAGGRPLVGEDGPLWSEEAGLVEDLDVALVVVVVVGLQAEADVGSGWLCGGGVFGCLCTGSGAGTGLGRVRTARRCGSRIGIQSTDDASSLRLRLRTYGDLFFFANVPPTAPPTIAATKSRTKTTMSNITLPPSPQ